MGLTPSTLALAIAQSEKEASAQLAKAVINLADACKHSAQIYFGAGVYPQSPYYKTVRVLL